MTVSGFTGIANSGGRDVQAGDGRSNNGNIAPGDSGDPGGADVRLIELAAIAAFLAGGGPAGAT